MKKQFKVERIRAAFFINLMVHMVGLSQNLIFSFLTIPGLCVSIITKYTNKRGTQFQICTVMSAHILKAVIKCPAAGHGLKQTKCTAVKNFHATST